MLHCVHRGVALAILVSLCAATARADIAAELKKLHGAWTLVRETADGVEEPVEKLRGIQLIFGPEAAWRVEKDGKTVGAGSMTIDPEKKPKTIDYTFTQGELKGKKFIAIYEVDGDTFRHCGVIDGARPTEFTAKAGSKRYLVTFKRIMRSTGQAGDHAK